MTLEEFYKDNKKVKVFNYFTHINNNEIYKVEYDDEGTMTLFSKKARDQGWDIISEEVFEFTYIDDGRIIYRDLDYDYDLPTTVYVSFTNEEDFSVGALTKYGLVYVKDDKFVVIEDPNQNKKIIHICGEGEYDDEPSYGCLL